MSSGQSGRGGGWRGDPVAAGWPARSLALLILFWLAGSVAAEDLVFVALAPSEGFFRSAFDRVETHIEQTFADDTDVKLLVRGEAGTEEVMVAALRRGRAQLGVSTVPGAFTAVPELGLLMAPYLFESFPEADFVLDEFLAEPVARLLAAKGLVFIQWFDSGWWNLFATRPIPTPADGRGMRLRAASGDAAVLFLRAFDADVIPLPFAEVIPGLQTGLIDGGATNTAMYAAVEMYQHAPHLTLTRHAINPGMVMANKRWFEALPAARQRLVRDAFLSSDVMRAGVRQEEQEALEEVIRRGLPPYEPTPAELAAWRALARPLHQALIERIGGASAELYGRIQQGKAAFAARQGEP